MHFFKNLMSTYVTTFLHSHRYTGYKGVLAAWPDHLYRQIHQLTFRKSMCEFPSTNIDLETLNWAKFNPAYLNRQVVNLLSSLGVSNEAFINLQVLLVDNCWQNKYDHDSNDFMTQNCPCCLPPL